MELNFEFQVQSKTRGDELVKNIL